MNTIFLAKTVYIDPKIAEILREHQIEGVQFMYDCISGKKGFKIRGCILADSFGLGKTLQTIALLVPPPLAILS